MDPFGLGWKSTRGGGDRQGERAYHALTGNLHLVPIISPNQGTHDIFFEEESDHQTRWVWQIAVHSQDTTADWNRMQGTYPPITTLWVVEGRSSNSVMVCPSTIAQAHWVLLRMPKGRTGRNTMFSPWNSENAFLEQHQWQDESALLHTSTTLLRKMQASH